jgi:hypothetical protein
MKTPKQADIELWAEKIIVYIPPYGEYNLDSIEEQMKAIAFILEGRDVPKFTVHPEGYREQQLKEYEEGLKYLVDYGFATNRYDIKVEGKIYWQLTDKGRLLKEIGTMEGFRHHELQEKKEGISRKFRERNSYIVTLSIAVSTFVSAVYYFFQLYDGGTREHRCIAISLIPLSLICILLLMGFLRNKSPK